MTVPRLAVCIPAYNQPEFLRDALSSLCDQGVARGEMVVAIADDASPTPLDGVIDAFRDRLEIRYLRHGANRGHLANFAAAFDMVAAPFVSFLPHDDLIAPGHFGRALAAIECEPDCVLSASLVVCAPHPGPVVIQHHGFFPSGAERARFGELYRWTRDEWMALSLITTPMSIVGSIFRADVFRRCREWLSFPLWHDRLMLAEMGRHGQVMTLPWVAGYYRVGGAQLSRRLWTQSRGEVLDASRRVLGWCADDGVAVDEYWAERIATATRPDRVTFLQLLEAALPLEDYRRIKAAAERRLGARISTSRLERLGVPGPAAAAIRQLYAALGRRLG